MIKEGNNEWRPLSFLKNEMQDRHRQPCNGKKNKQIIQDSLGCSVLMSGGRIYFEHWSVKRRYDSRIDKLSSDSHDVAIEILASESAKQSKSRR